MAQHYVDSLPSAMPTAAEDEMMRKNGNMAETLNVRGGDVIVDFVD